MHVVNQIQLNFKMYYTELILVVNANSHVKIYILYFYTGLLWDDIQKQWISMYIKYRVSVLVWQNGIWWRYNNAGEV